MSKYHYHYWHHRKFNKVKNKEGATIKLKVPTMPNDHHDPILPNTTEPKVFCSLKNDMDILRDRGAKKGIVDANVIDVGKSTKGRKLWALKIGNGSEHKVLFTGCHHAREWISVEMPYLVAKYLIDNYTDKPQTANDRKINRLLNNRQIWFVPMVNPDGFIYTTKKDRWWRPNRNSVKIGKKTIQVNILDKPITQTKKIKIKKDTYRGIDINRNYATKTWGYETTGTTQDPGKAGRHSIWCGETPGSEIETKVIQKLFADNTFSASISYHSFSELLIYPFSDKPVAGTPKTFIYKVGKAMTKLMGQNGIEYKYVDGHDPYPTSGDFCDYALEQSAARPTYTVELRPKRLAPKHSWFSGLIEEEIELCFKENLPAALALINCAGIGKKSNGIPGKQSVQLKSKNSKATVQTVRNCWEAFDKKNWSLKGHSSANNNKSKNSGK